jgi:hypothetical protein
MDKTSDIFKKTDAPACGRTKFRHQRKVENCMGKARDISRRKIHIYVEVEMKIVCRLNSTTNIQKNTTLPGYIGQG